MLHSTPESPAQDEVADAEDSKTFEPRRAPYWSMLTLLVAAGVAAFIVWTEPDVMWDGIAVVVVAAGALAFAEMGKFRRAMSVVVGPHGFVAVDTLGRRHPVAWDEVKRVTLFRVGWIRLLRVRTSRLSHWIPLEMEDAPGLRDEITRRVGRGHRLADALWRELR